MGADRELWPDEYTVFNILYDKFLFWAIVVGIFTFLWLLIAILRYREGIEPAGKEELKVGTFPKDRHNFTLEFAWFIGPTILVIWVTILAFGSMNIVWGEVANLQNDDDSFTVEVNGVQWAWEFRYQEALTWEDVRTGNDVTWDTTTGLVINASSDAAIASVTIGTSSFDLDLANETTYGELFNEIAFQGVVIKDADGNTLHRWQHIPEDHMLATELIIPCDTNVLFNIHSDKYGDKSSIYQGVQHAFWLQEWGMKEDAVPGLEGGTWMYVQPNEPGVFPIRCAEYCGEFHSLMIGQVEVVAKEGMNCDEDFGIYFDHKEMR